MSSDPEYSAALRIVEKLRAAFPEQASQVDAAMARDHYGEAPHIWIERFSQLTTNAIRRGDTGIAAKHLDRVAALLD
jgi:hypothetical protein